MLSYQHSYHAGNFADVHKHLTLSYILSALNKKSKPWSYLETHAGVAVYDLQGDNSNKTGEYKRGIAKVWQHKSHPVFGAYSEVITALNRKRGADRLLSFYPGSPWFAAEYSREQDSVSLMELHPQEFETLKKVFRSEKNIAVHHRDGYEGVLSLLPPKPNRGAVLIDPSYEVKTEYLQVATFLKKAHQRWSNGCFIIWYPLLKAGNHLDMLRTIKNSGIRKVLKSEFCVTSSSDERMYGSGMLIVNPPWQLDEQLISASDVCFDILADEEADKPKVEWLVPE